MEKSKPDNVVFNNQSEEYDAKLKPYGTTLGAPSIKITDTSSWKNRSISSINHRVRARYLELKAEYEKMMEEFEYNNLIFNSTFNFKPNVGDIYHLYERKNKETFLSIIAPHECNFKSIGSFYLNADQIWEKL